MRLIIPALVVCLFSYWYFPAVAKDQTPCVIKQVLPISFADTPLPIRAGPKVITSGRVPHTQLGVVPDPSLNDQLNKLVYTLPNIEEHPTIVSLPGAKGMWLADDVPVKHPKAIAAGREFAHIHPDGSLHAPLSYKRALEVEKNGWGELHPWSNTREGWEGFVMLYSANTEDQLQVLIQLVTESYNYVTGLSVAVPEC